MASLRLPTLKQLERMGMGQDAFETLAVLERELNAALAELPESDKWNRGKIKARLSRLQARREEYKAKR